MELHVVLLSLALAARFGGDCEPHWRPTLGQAPGLDDAVLALTVFDDGSGGGPALFAGGSFEQAGGTPAVRIARWDGASWSPLGEGMSGSFSAHVAALTVFDAGGGPALYAGGDFIAADGVPASNLARWDGSSWSEVGGGTNNDVLALTVFDDGSGPALYAGGSFSQAGGQAAAGIARWDGTTWSALGSGVNFPVYAFATYDDGSGPALFVGGDFGIAGGAPAPSVAKWDGTTWSALGSGMVGFVKSLAVFDDGAPGGATLVAGGKFQIAGGVLASNLARWDGSVWSAVAGGMDGEVHALAVFDDGSGPALYAGGPFTSAGGQAASRMARWDGASWSSLGSGMDVGSVEALACFQAAGGAELHAGGTFGAAGDVPVLAIARWDGASWGTLGRGPDESVSALLAVDDGSDSGPSLYLGGDFTTAAGVAASHVARWDGSSCASLGAGTNGQVEAFAMFDDGSGSGPALHAGGSFTLAGGESANCIAKWDGATWSPLGTGMDDTVLTLAVFDDGSGGGPALYAGGRFASAGGIAAQGIARWDGASWSPLGLGTSFHVFALTVFDDGDGPALYVGGNFGGAGGIPAANIARWDGTSWSAVGNGLTGSVSALAVLDDGGGPSLYAAGSFLRAGGELVHRIAKLEGGSWSGLGSGFGEGVDALAVFDDGSGAGPALYASHGFPNCCNGGSAGKVSRWDGTSWSPLADWVNGRVTVLAVFDDSGEAGPALFAGGSFVTGPHLDDSYLAGWQGCLDTSAPVIHCPVSIAKGEAIGSPPGETVIFSVTASDNHDPAPDLVCSPPSGSFFPQGTTLVNCTATDDSGNVSTRAFPVTVQLKTRKH